VIISPYTTVSRDIVPGRDSRDMSSDINPTSQALIHMGLQVLDVRNLKLMQGIY